jgi:hypothetical protein
MTTPIQARMIGANTCAALGVSVASTAPVSALCRKLVKEGYDPALPLQVWRGTKPYRLVHSIANPDHHTNFKRGGKAA